MLILVLGLIYVAAEGVDAPRPHAKELDEAPSDESCHHSSSGLDDPASAAPFNVAAQTDVAPLKLSSDERGESDRASSAAATPQTAAFPDRTCWIGWYPLEHFCFVLTEERR